MRESHYVVNVCVCVYSGTVCVCKIGINKCTYFTFYFEITAFLNNKILVFCVILRKGNNNPSCC